MIRSGERVRVTAQLLRASTDQHIWADTYDRDRGDILKLQSEVADAIAQQVRAEITPMQRAQMGKARVVNPAAYDSYVRGRLYFTTEFTKSRFTEKGSTSLPRVDPKGSELRSCLRRTGGHLRLSGFYRSIAAG